MRWVFLIYLILNPLFFLIGADQRDAQMLCFQLSSVALFCVGMFFPQKELKTSKLNISIGALMLLFIFAWFRTMSGWFIAQNLLFGILVYLTAIKTLNKDDIPFIYKGISYVAVFAVIVLAFQFMGWDFRGAVISGGNLAPPESIFFQRSAMGMYFAQTIPIILSFSWLGPLLLLPMQQSLSTGAYLGAISGMLFFFWFRKRIAFWISMALLTIAVVIGLTASSITQEASQGLKVRIPMWSIVFQDIVRNPIGYGLDSFARPPLEGQWKYYNFFNGKTKEHKCIRALKKDGQVRGFTPAEDDAFRETIDSGNLGYITHADHPHNEFLWIAYEIGIASWIVVGFIFYFIWDRFKRCRKDVLACSSMAVMVCILTESFLQFPFHLARISHIVPFILGVFYISTED